MSPGDKQASDEPETEGHPPDAESRTSKEKGPKKASSGGYEFKIVPADPKNALNFEDVADK